MRHIEQTLPKNLADNAGYERCKFLVLDYGDPDHLCGYLKTKHAKEIESGRVVVYSYREPGPFRMAHAKNMAHRLGMIEGADILCNLDADNFTGAGFAEYIAECFTNYEVEPFLWANRNQPSEVRYPKGCNGRIVVSRNTFLISGGYDEAKYNSWGPDDKDFHHRLRRLEYAPKEIARRYLEVVLHNDKMRFREYQHVQTALQDPSFGEVDGVTTIANYGKFGCGTVFKNFNYSRPIELKPLPTRVFGIGMHKTGTTSLHVALQMLRFDSVHWKSVKWAKKLWMEMLESSRSIALEKHYCLSDLPIPLLYEKLDKAYPGSKFILTTRDEASWLKSVNNHWSRWNQFKVTWKKENSFPLQIHKELYGQTDFDEAVFLARYRKHNADVLEYFKDRPDDLLIMDMTKSSSGNWADLCGFLGQPVPSEPYPIAFSFDNKIESAPAPSPPPLPLHPVPATDPKFSVDHHTSDSFSPEEVRALKVLIKDLKKVFSPGEGI